MARTNTRPLDGDSLHRLVGVWIRTLRLVLFGARLTASGVYLECHDDSHLGCVQRRMGLERGLTLARLGSDGPDGSFDCQCALADKACK